MRRSRRGRPSARSTTACRWTCAPHCSSRSTSTTRWSRPRTGWRACAPSTRSASRTTRAADPFQLLQTAHDRRHRRIGEAGLPVRDADFAQVNVALRVERDPVRREELADVESRPTLAAEPRDALALRVHNGQARTEIGRMQIDRHAGAEFADDEIRLLAAAAAQRAGTMKVVPLRLVFAIAVEHLHA